MHIYTHTQLTIQEVNEASAQDKKKADEAIPGTPAIVVVAN